MTIFQFGVIVFAFCLTTQVVSTNNTTPMAGNSTDAPNPTIMATLSSTNATNATTATGAGVSLHAGPFSIVAHFIMAASLLQHYW
ncbi:unnamed protein product [Pleuronectes platessa]|uniref:Uncharacterized protein n=1 Tax=Pleuronectes platessa TaxID=8262 RepID=A0A9N7YCG9_PLEPL|nr:unnamed protein product [Pleuronectes platessa]